MQSLHFRLRLWVGWVICLISSGALKSPSRLFWTSLYPCNGLYLPQQISILSSATWQKLFLWELGGFVNCRSFWVMSLFKRFDVLGVIQGVSDCRCLNRRETVVSIRESMKSWKFYASLYDMLQWIHFFSRISYNCAYSALPKLCNFPITGCSPMFGHSSRSFVALWPVQSQDFVFFRKKATITTISRGHHGCPEYRISLKLFNYPPFQNSPKTSVDFVSYPGIKKNALTGISLGT